MGKRQVTIITYDCPNCGATVKIDHEHSSATCDYCGTHFAIESERVTPPNAGYDRSRQPVNRRPGTKRSNAVVLTVIIVLLATFIITPFVLGIILTAAGIGKSTPQRTVVQTTEADPFKDIQLQFDGMEPWAKVQKVTADTGIRDIEYVLDKQTKLSNGDVITIQAKDLKGYKWTTPSYKYTVSGLNSLITNAAQLSEADQEMLYSAAESEIKKAWEENLQNTDFTMESLNVSIQPYKIYISVNTNEEYYSYVNNNIIYPAFETTFEGNGKTYTLYQYATIHNVYLSPDGSLHGDFESMHAANGIIFSDDYNFDRFFAIWGYESLLKMESSMEDENYNLMK